MYFKGSPTLKIFVFYYLDMMLRVTWPTITEVLLASSRFKKVTLEN